MQMDDIDLSEVASRLRERMHTVEPEGYLRGKAVLRDLIRSMLGCSDLEAEDLVDTLELHGYLHYTGDKTERSQAHAGWDVNPAVEL